MRLLLIDNHDSFTAILHHYLWELAGERPLLYRNDELTRDELESLAFDAVVLSPGPGHPANVRDFGVCRDVLDLFPQTPVLGVCLGMQGMVHHAGGRIVPWDGALHGRPSRIAHDGAGLFKNIPDEFTAIRYHSLIVDPDALPDNVRVTARSIDDGTIMAVRFADRPWQGVQFHPESFATEYGKVLLANFLDLVKPDRIKPKEPLTSPAFPETRKSETQPPHSSLAEPAQIPMVALAWRDPAETFVRYFSGVTNTFWLDGTAWETCVMGRAESTQTFTDYSVWKTWIDDLSLRAEHQAPWKGYRGGPVGHLAYELYRETLMNTRADAGKLPAEAASRWLLPAGWLAFDRGAQKVWAAWEGKVPPAWLQAVMAEWNEDRSVESVSAALPPFAAWTPRVEESAYVAQVAALQDAIARGETYEACLTHAFSVRSKADPLGVWLRVRDRNPAPYAAYFNFPDVHILSASPELFLEASSGVARSRPIKGTRRRGASVSTDQALREDLATSKKDAAENLMIVDLTRHDLARVCDPGTVEVPVFLKVEEHPAVFQLVSEVRGNLARGVNATDVIAACFPGGSMTGAPKERTVELLSKVEVAPRGIYSGALGYLTGGAFRLSMVIRTLENRNDTWTVGCGGAVLADSDPAAEWHEALIKARSVIDAAGEGPST